MFLLVVSLTHITLSSAKPRYILEVVDKEGDEEDGRLAEDEGDQDEVVVGGQDDRDYRMVIIL